MTTTEEGLPKEIENVIDRLAKKAAGRDASSPDVGLERLAILYELSAALPPTIAETARELYEDGVSWLDMGKRVGATPASIRARAIPQERPRPESTTPKVGMGVADVVRETGVGASSVWHVVKKNPDAKWHTTVVVDGPTGPKPYLRILDLAAFLEAKGEPKSKKKSKS